MALQDIRDRLGRVLAIVAGLMIGGDALGQEPAAGGEAGETWLKELYAGAAEQREFRSLTRVVANSTDPRAGTLMLNEFRVRVDRDAQRYAVRVPGMYHVLVDGPTLTVVLEGIEDHYLRVELAEPATFESVLEYMVPLAPAVPMLSVDFALMLDGDLEGLLPGLRPSPLGAEHEALMDGDGGGEALKTVKTLSYGGGRAVFADQNEQAVAVVFDVHPWIRLVPDEHGVILINLRVNAAVREQTADLFAPELGDRRPEADPDALAGLVVDRLSEEHARMIGGYSDEQLEEMHDQILTAHDQVERELAGLGDSATDRRDRLFFDVQRRDLRARETVVAERRGVPSRID